MVPATAVATDENNTTHIGMLRFDECDTRVISEVNAKISKKHKNQNLTLVGRADGSDPAGDINHETGGRLPLLHVRPQLPSQPYAITALGDYQIILLGDRGTQV